MTYWKANSPLQDIGIVIIFLKEGERQVKSVLIMICVHGALINTNGDIMSLLFIWRNQTQTMDFWTVERDLKIAGGKREKNSWKAW